MFIRVASPVVQREKPEQGEKTMALHRGYMLLQIVSAGLLAGCASTPYTPTPFEPAPVNTQAYVSKVDAFAVVMDASSSMNFKYDDRRNFYTAKDVVSHLNQTIPELGYRSALVGFGTGSCVNGEKAAIVYGPATYQRADFADGISKLECAGGRTPMSKGIEAGGGTLNTGSGQVALILVSDFWEIDSKAVVEAANKLHETYGDRLCIHTIKVGEPDEAASLRAALAGINGCGSDVSAESLASPTAMAGFVTDALLKPAPAAPVVRYEKNTLSAAALFDLNKATLKESGKAALHDLDEAIKARDAKVVDINIVGHTDSSGTAEYNMALSLRRAETVRDYIVSEGIDPSIIHVSGLGESEPVASNATAEGRAQNRRVDINVGIQEPTD
jgi:OOP family OmpA-OmpF porin